MGADSPWMCRVSWCPSLKTENEKVLRFSINLLGIALQIYLVYGIHYVFHIDIGACGLHYFII